MAGDAEHFRDTEPVHIGVDDADLVPHLCQCDGEVYRHGGLAHSALAAGDRDDADGRVRTQE